LSPEIPEIDDCCDKELYAFYGLAAYWSQVLEHSAIILALILKLPEVNLVDQELFDELFKSLTKKTFGRLLTISKGVLELTEEDERFLNETLELRNILVHHYFREHAEDLISEVGRRAMKKELQLIISKFKRTDSILEKLYAPLWGKYGVTDESIELELQKMLKAAELRDEKV